MYRYFSAGSLFIFVIILFSSCKLINKDKIDYSDIQEIVIYPDSNSFNQLSDVFEQNYNVIVLESSDSAMFGRASQIIYGLNQIYILDRNHTHDILCFSKEGEFIARNNVLSKSNQKYGDICNMYLDSEQSTIEVLIDNPASVIVYDSNLNYLSENAPGFYVYQFAKNRNGDYLYFTADSKASKDIYHNLIINNDANTVLSKYFPVSDGDNIFRRSLLSNNFAQFGDTTIFIQPFTDTIFGLVDDDLFAKYFINFGKHKVPNDLYKDYNATDFDEFYSYLSEKKYAYNMEPVFESEDYLLFYFFYNNSWKNFFIYSKKTKRKMFSNSISNDINSMPYFMVETFFQPESNSIITSVPVYKIKKRFEEVKSNFTDIEFAEYIEKHKDLYKVYLESENTDNPILIVYKLKNKL